MTTLEGTEPVVNDKREIFGWAMYDWANSAFSTTVGTVFLGPYVASLARSAAEAAGTSTVSFSRHPNCSRLIPSLLYLFLCRDASVVPTYPWSHRRLFKSPQTDDAAFCHHRRIRHNIDVLPDRWILVVRRYAFYHRQPGFWRCHRLL